MKKVSLTTIISILLAVYSFGQTAQEYFNRGIQALNAKRYTEAINNFSQVIKLNPNSYEAWYNRGLAYSGLNQLDLAIADYSQAIKLNPNFADAFNNRGIAYADKGNLDLAIADYSQAIRLNPNYANAFNNRGIAYHNKGDLDLALADYSQAIKLNPNFVEAFNNRCYVYKRKGNFDLALADCNQAIKLNPNYSNAYLVRGMVYFDTKRYELAKADFEKVLQLDANNATAKDYLARIAATMPKNPSPSSTSANTQQTAEAFFKLGNEQLQKNQYDAAIASFSECIKLNAKADGCYTNRASALTLKSTKEFSVDAYTEYDGVNVINKTRQAALQDINKALELNPKNSTAYLVRGYIYELEGIHDKAVADYRSSLALNPNNQFVKDKLAKAEKEYARSLMMKALETNIRAGYLAERDAIRAAKLYQEAIDLCTKSIELDKSNYRTWETRGSTYRYLKNYNAAIADFNEALRLKPDDAGTLIERAQTFLEQGKVSLALADYEKVIAMPVNRDTEYYITNALIGRGKIRLDAGQLDSAIADFDKVISINDKHTGAYFHRGQAYAKKKNKVQAIADFRKALELYPAFEEAKAELRKLGVEP